MSATEKAREALTPAEAFDPVEYVLETLLHWASAEVVENCRTEVRGLMRSLRQPAADEVEALAKCLENRSVPMYPHHFDTDANQRVRDDMTRAAAMLRSLSRQPSEEATRKAVEALKPFAEAWDMLERNGYTEDDFIQRDTRDRGGIRGHAPVQPCDLRRARAALSERQEART